MHDLIPNGPDEFTAGWLTDVLQGAWPGVVVRGVSVTGGRHGSSATARLRVETDGAAGVPGSFVVKGSFTEGLGDDELARGWVSLMAMLNETECGFYARESGIMGDRTPRSHFTAFDRGRSIIVLEDLHDRPDLRFGTFDRPLDADEMASVLDALATLHTARWDDPALTTHPLRDGFLEGGMLDGFLSRTNWDQQMARPRRAVVPVELTDHATVTDAIRTAWAAKRTGPQSLVHGDPHTGNLFFDRDGAGLVDWHLFGSGHWAADVVYAVASAMDTEARRTHERDLLRHYLEQVGARTSAAPSWDAAWRDYRKFAIWGVAALLTPGDGVQDEEYNTVVGGRHARAAVDHGSIALLRER